MLQKFENDLQSKSLKQLIKTRRKYELDLMSMRLDADDGYLEVFSDGLKVNKCESKLFAANIVLHEKLNAFITKINDNKGSKNSFKLTLTIDNNNTRLVYKDIKFDKDGAVLINKLNHHDFDEDHGANQTEVINFLERYNGLHLDNWKDEYNIIDYLIPTHDGLEWCLEVFYNEIDVFIYIGSHTYPGNFHRLLNLFDVKEDLV